ncbi:hypothetical protein [Actinokineospora iranica]|nr:hypothetical protein [Actinokineospora iranica]
MELAGGGFYVLAAAVFAPVDQGAARAAMLGLRGTRDTRKLHWNEMDIRQRVSAAREVAALGGLHVVTVGAPVPNTRQERARAMCLERLVTELHGYGVVELFVESRTKELDERDVKTIIGARFHLPKGSRFHVDHARGADEPLFWVADIVAGAVRAHHIGDPTYRRLLDDCVYEIDVLTGC